MVDIDVKICVNRNTGKRSESFHQNIRDAKRFMLKMFENDTVILKIGHCINAEINVRLLEFWIIDKKQWMKSSHFLI